MTRYQQCRRALQRLDALAPCEGHYRDFHHRRGDRVFVHHAHDGSDPPPDGRPVGWTCVCHAREVYTRRAESGGKRLPAEVVRGHGQD